jgi:hypothetical protein
MIKARGEGKDGRPVLILGLSHGNIGALVSGRPIKFDAKPYGFDGEILIFAGKDEKEMGDVIRSIDPEVPTFNDPNPT